MIRICIAGKNDIAVNALEYILKHYYNANEIAIIANKTDEGKDTWQKSLLKAAKSYHVQILNLQEAYEIPNLLFISLEFDRIIKTQNFRTSRLFNIHFSNLPKYKGVFTSILPILYGENKSGVTLHCINNGIDTGDIIAQKLFAIHRNDSARDLYFKYLKHSFMLFVKNIESLITNSFRAKPQKPIHSSYFSRHDVDFTHKLNLNKTSFQIHNHIRALIFQEYQLPQIHGIHIQKSILTNEIIQNKTLQECKDRFILSGIDGFKILAYKDSNTTGGGGKTSFIPFLFFIFLFSLLFCSIFLFFATLYFLFYVICLAKLIFSFILLFLYSNKIYLFLCNVFCCTAHYKKENLL